jgi:hypothetical protein
MARPEGGRLSPPSSFDSGATFRSMRRTATGNGRVLLDLGERAECVMLNKGPYVVEGVKTLDDILCRMQDHQEKKRSMLRKLRVATGFARRRQGAISSPTRDIERNPEPAR